MAFTHALTTNNYGPAKLIVSSSTANGTHTTITSAIADAVSGDTIFIRAGTYTENFSMKAGVNLSAFQCDSTTTGVVIIGTVTASYNGAVSCSGIRFQTNGAAAISVSGSSSSSLWLNSCVINATNSTGLSVNSANFVVHIYNSIFFATATFSMYDITTISALNIRRTSLAAGDGTANNIASGSVTIFESDIAGSLTTSSSGTVQIYNSNFNNSNIAALTTAGTGTSLVSNCVIISGTASAISIGSGTTVSVTNSTLTSSNTNVITGAGTLKYANLSFDGSSSTINTSSLTLDPVSKIYVPTGITFDNTNTLSTYLTTTYSPALAFGGSSTGITYTTQLGKYYRVGNLVFVDIFILLSSKGAQTGTATVSLPLTSANDSHFPVFATQYTNLTFVTATQVSCYLSPNTSTLTVIAQGSVTNTTLSNTAFANNTQLQITGFYWTA